MYHNSEGWESSGNMLDGTVVLRMYSKRVVGVKILPSPSPIRCRKVASLFVCDYTRLDLESKRGKRLVRLIMMKSRSDRGIVDSWGKGSQ